MADLSQEQTPNFTDLPKFVRIRSEANARFIEFDFAIGDPCLFVELVLPPSAFKAFCVHNQVVPMSPEQMAMVDAEAEKWRYGHNTLVGHARQT
ncbi:MAG: phenol hydroxylase [Neisseriaceae bacterium]|nr:phenol hydroxylase [Neisseriaceae bacterium]